MGLLRLLLLLLIIYIVWRAIQGARRALLDQQKQPSPADPPRSAHQVLGVAPGASPEEIRAAYQRLVQQYHPDRVSGLGPELVELAERRTKQINAAYATLKQG